jgi:hypothetical protein
MWKPKEKIPLGKLRHRWESNAKIRTIGPWSQSDSRYGEEMNFYGSDDEPSFSIICREFLD